MPFISRAEAQLYYEVHGEGPAVVLAHGVGGNHATWFQQVGVFARSYRVVTFDHRGFGNSTDSQGLGRDAFVDDLCALLDHLQLERAALIGQSMGGGTCVGFANRRPERVTALVLADTLHGLTEVDANGHLMAQARAATDGLSQLDRVLGQDFRTREPTLSLLYAQLASFNATDRRNLRGAFAPLVSPQMLASARIPALFIAGQHDLLFPPAAIQAVQREVPGSFYVEVSGAGHSAYFERPTEFNDTVLSFFQAIRYPGIRRPAHSNTAGYTPATE
ncbi:MAG: alpha/beta fold hydrolase [Proteobacteria bacterium]|nr:alpha/beta fold hydrolase [Pseudomonadota bacterium]